mgnify:CR=1 FL=1
MIGRVRAGGQRRMPHHGFGIGVAVMGVLVDNAVFVKVSEAAFSQTVIDRPRHVPPELIDCNLKNQFRRPWGSALAMGVCRR